MGKYNDLMQGKLNRILAESAKNQAAPPRAEAISLGKANRKHVFEKLQGE